MTDLYKDTTFDEEEVKAMFEHLDNLRESGTVNMFGARPYLAVMFDITKGNAGRILSRWMETFTQRHPNPVILRK